MVGSLVVGNGYRLMVMVIRYRCSIYSQWILYSYSHLTFTLQVCVSTMVGIGLSMVWLVSVSGVSHSSSSLCIILLLLLPWWWYEISLVVIPDTDILQHMSPLIHILLQWSPTLLRVPATPCQSLLPSTYYYSHRILGEVGCVAGV